MRKPFHSKKNQQNPNFILFFKYTKEREIERKRERERERERERRDCSKKEVKFRSL